VLFGGIDDNGDLIGDTWEWDGANWTQVADAGPPALHAAVSVMSSVILLSTLSVVVGLALGRFSWHAIAISGGALALLSSVILHKEGFGALGGIAVIFLCLTLNQFAYLAGIVVVHRGLLQKPVNEHPGEHRDRHIGRKDQPEQGSPTARKIG
jgi:hypothetical protein